MNNPIDTATAKSYLDFSGLGELRGKAQQNQAQALNETAQQFEGLFIQMMMKSMRDATMKDEANESSARETFEGMFDKEVSLKMAQRNSLGIADFLKTAVQHQQTPNTAAMLQARDKAGLSLQPPERPLPFPPAVPRQQGLPLDKPRIKSLQELQQTPHDRSGT